MFLKSEAHEFYLCDPSKFLAIGTQLVLHKSTRFALFIFPASTSGNDVLLAAIYKPSEKQQMVPLRFNRGLFFMSLCITS